MDVAVDTGQQRPGGPDVDVADADTMVDLLRFQETDEILEIADVAGVEVPAVVDRQLDATGRAPRGGRWARRRGRLAQTRQSAGLEHRHQECVVGRVRLEPSRADDPGIGEVPVLLQGRREAREHGGHV